MCESRPTCAEQDRTPPTSPSEKARKDRPPPNRSKPEEHGSFKVVFTAKASQAPHKNPANTGFSAPPPLRSSPPTCAKHVRTVFSPLLAASIRIRLGSWIGGWRGVSVSWIRSLKGVLFLCIRHVLYEPDELETRKPRQTRGFSGLLQTTNFYELLRTIGGPGRQPGWERVEGSEGKPMMDASRSAPSRRRSSEVFT